jgi:hypothetical protein
VASERKTGSRWMLILIFFICAVPFLLALVLFQNPQWLSSRTNYGNLIVPAVPVDRSKLSGFDAFSRQNLNEIKGHWVLLHVVTAGGCQKVCKESLYKTKQIRLMLNKDLLRVRRVVMLGEGADEQQAGDRWQDDQYLLRLHPGEGVIELLSEAIGRPLEEGMVFVMDPMGNVLLWYPPGFDPYGVKKDLKRLLSVSQIG